MLFAVLDFTDYVFIAALIVVLTGGMAAARGNFGPANARGLGRVKQKLDRLEQKLDLLLSHAGLEYTPAPKPAWQAIADEGPSHKISAIKSYRDETGAGLVDAKRAVEEYMEGR